MEWEESLKNNYDIKRKEYLHDMILLKYPEKVKSNFYLQNGKFCQSLGKTFIYRSLFYPLIPGRALGKTKSNTYFYTFYR